MDKEIKAKWLELLHSNTYGQTGGRLVGYEDGKLCLCATGALGVVAGMRIDTEYGPALVLDGVADAFYTRNLPETVLQRAGITHDAQSHIVVMNDIESRTFSDIAQWIEANL